MDKEARKWSSGFTVTMRKERDTKNAVRFQEVKVEGQPEKIGAQYIQKTAFGNGAPEEIKIEVSW